MASTSTAADCLISSISDLLTMTHTEPPIAEKSTVPVQNLQLKTPTKRRNCDQNDTGSQPKKSVRFNTELSEYALYTDTELLRTPEKERIFERFISPYLSPNPSSIARNETGYLSAKESSTDEKHRRSNLIKNRKCTPIRVGNPRQVKVVNADQGGSMWINVDGTKIRVGNNLGLPESETPTEKKDNKQSDPAILRGHWNIVNSWNVQKQDSEERFRKNKKLAMDKTKRGNMRSSASKDSPYKPNPYYKFRQNHFLNVPPKANIQQTTPPKSILKNQQVSPHVNQSLTPQDTCSHTEKSGDCIVVISPARNAMGTVPPGKLPASSTIAKPASSPADPFNDDEFDSTTRTFSSRMNWKDNPAVESSSADSIVVSETDSSTALDNLQGGSWMKPQSTGTLGKEENPRWRAPVKECKACGESRCQGMKKPPCRSLAQGSLCEGARLGWKNSDASVSVDATTAANNVDTARLRLRRPRPAWVTSRPDNDVNNDSLSSSIDALPHDAVDTAPRNDALTRLVKMEETAAKMRKDFWEMNH